MYCWYGSGERMIVNCSQCNKEIDMEEVEIKYHSPVVNGSVNHVWCDAYCSFEWHKIHGNNYEIEKTT